MNSAELFLCLALVQLRSIIGCTEFIHRMQFLILISCAQVTKSGNPWFRQELEFDLVTVSIDDILDNIQDLSGSGSVE